MKAVLFDLDGTLADTAPDLAYALNCMRTARGLAPIASERLRPVCSAGARGLLGAGFDIAPGHTDYAEFSKEFLATYAQHLCRETRLFPGMQELLRELEQRALPWGVVTNKAARFTLPLMDLLGLQSRAACVISGDSTAHIKPHPEPLLAASRKIGIAPVDCLYVGDDMRDIQAAHAASMKAVVAGFGYLNGTAPDTWGADAIIATPLALLALLD